MGMITFHTCSLCVGGGLKQSRRAFWAYRVEGLRFGVEGLGFV